MAFQQKSNDKKFNYSQCGECGNITPVNVWGVCGECHERDQLMFEKVRDKVSLTDVLTPEELKERTGVPEKTIKRWIAAGRFRISSS